MTIYYADLGKSGTGDGSLGNQYGKDQWDTINPAGLDATALQIKGMATYTRDIKVCGLNTISKWPLITSQDPAVPFRINAPGYSVQFNQPSPQFEQGTAELSNAVIYCHDISLPASHDCFFSVDATWQFPGGIGGDVIKNCVIYNLSGYVPFTDITGTIKNSIIYELATGYHLLKTGGILDTVLTNDSNLSGLTDGSWTDDGTTYNYTNHGGVPSGWDDANLYNFALGIKTDVQDYVPSWIPFPVGPTTPNHGIHYAIEIFSNPSDSWSAITNATAGLETGVFRMVTDRPQYDGLTHVPVYGANEIDVNGASVGSNTIITPWKEGMIQKDGFTENPAREIDIVACGQYSTDMAFSFKIRGDSFVTDTVEKAFWKFCSDNDIDFTGRRVVMWIVIDDVFYQCARGRITNNPINETDYEFDVQDDAKLIHKMLPPLVTNPTNNPDIPDSDQGQPIPIVIGDVSKSKILKLTSTNTFITLCTGGGINYTLAAAASYSRGTDPYAGPFILNLITDYVLFSADQLAGYYLSIAKGDSNANLDEVYKILSNTATTTTGHYGHYETQISLATPIQNSDGLTLMTNFVGNPRGVTFFNRIYDIIAQCDPINTYWFRISQFSIETIVSNESNISIQSNSAGMPDLSTWDSSLNEYNDISNIANINSSGTEVSVSANSAAVDGTVKSYIAMKSTIVRFGFLNGVIGAPGYPTETINDLTSIAKVTDKDRTTSVQMATEVISDGLLFVDFEGFALTANTASVPDNAYFCIDFDLTDTTGSPILQIAGMTWQTTDIYGNIVSAPALSLPANEFSSRPDGVHFNFVPNNVLKNTPPGDNLTLLTYEAIPVGPNAGSTFKKILKVSDTSILTQPQISYIRLIIDLRCIFGGGPTNSFKVLMKEICLVGEYNVPTTNGDIYAKVSGELTGPQTTDPSHSTNDVYHAFMHILEDYDGIPKTLIDYGNLPATRGPRQWHVGRTLTERKNSIDYLNELCAHSFVGMFGTRTGKRGFQSFQNFDDFGVPTTGSGKTATHDKSLIVRTSIDSFEKTDISELFNSFFLQYNFDPGLQQYIRSFIVSQIDNLAFFPGINDVGGDTGVVPSIYASLAVLISTKGFVYGNIFYTTDGSDTTDNALAGIKGAGLIAGDSFLVTGGSTAVWEGVNSGLFPTWYNYFGGLIGDNSNPALNYADSKDIWDRCRASYTVNQSVKQPQSDISQLPWFIDTFLFNNGTDTWGHGTNSSAYLFLQLLAQWTTLQKYVVSYRIPINKETVETELLDVVTFNDVIYTAGEDVPGLIIHVEPDPATDQFVINAILKPGAIQGYNLIIERGPLLNTDLIQEGNHQTDTIIETGI